MKSIINIDFYNRVRERLNNFSERYLRILKLEVRNYRECESRFYKRVYNRKF